MTATDTTDHDFGEYVADALADIWSGSAWDASYHNTGGDVHCIMLINLDAEPSAPSTEWYVGAESGRWEATNVDGSRTVDLASPSSATPEQLIAAILLSVANNKLST